MFAHNTVIDASAPAADVQSVSGEQDGLTAQALPLVRSAPLTGMRRAQIVYLLRAQMGAAGLHVGTHDLLEFVKDIIRVTNMDTFDTPRGNGSSNGNNFGYSTTSTECVSHSIGEAGTPSSSCASDPATIARGIFSDEIKDVLIVLKNCGALWTADERQWCVEELKRLLPEQSIDDLT